MLLYFKLHVAVFFISSGVIFSFSLFVHPLYSLLLRPDLEHFVGNFGNGWVGFKGKDYACCSAGH
jgi:hypothetical protein